MKAKNLIITSATLVFLTFISGIILSSTKIQADGNANMVDELSITVNSACTLKGGADGTDTSGSSTYTTTLNAGNYTELPGSKLVTICNDNAGYSLYAIGFSGDSYDTPENTQMIHSTNSEYNINTGTSGDNSYWAMKLEAVTGTTPPTILNDFDAYHIVPSIYTQVAKNESTTETPSDDGASVQTKYKINLARGQMAGTYNGKVKYTMVHPNTAPTPPSPPAPSPSCNTRVPGVKKMQDINPSNAAEIMSNMANNTRYYLRDSRDDEPYCVAKISGAIWMIQNLRITGVVPAEGSNFTGNDVNISQCDLDKNVGECPGNTNRFSEDIPMTHDSGNMSYGVWYNFAAVSAKTITGYNNMNPATKDICPAGWHMPTYDVSGSAGSITSVVSNDNIFSPVTGGIYSSGDHYDESSRGTWWSTTVYGYGNRWTLVYNGQILVAGGNSAPRAVGIYLRCVVVPQS